MRKIILLIIAILIIGLAGCTPKTDVSNNDNENMSNENLVQSGDNIENDNNKDTLEGNTSQNTELTEKQLIEKYKLSDSYVLDEDMLRVSYYNILAPVYDEEGRYTNERIINTQEVISDGMNFKISCSKAGTHKWEFGEYDIYEIKVNDKLLEDCHASLEKLVYYGTFVGIIDMEPSDEYKEIIVSIGIGIENQYYIYRLAKDGFILLYEGTNFDNGGLILVNNRYIISVLANMVNDNLVMGYYTYEDGEFKYIDRFLTGEKIKDENGNYTENFRNQVFTAQSEGSIYCPTYYNGNIVNVGGKVKFLKQSKNENSISRYIYDVELAEDIKIWIGEQQITLPKGTILTYNQE